MTSSRHLFFLLCTGLLSLSFPASGQSSATPDPTSASAAAVTRTPTPYQDETAKAPRFSAQELEARRQSLGATKTLMDRVLAAMGGADRVDSVKSLILVGKTGRQSTEGLVQTEDRTWFQFPHSYRLDVTLRGATYSKLAVREGVFLITPTGAVQLPEPEKSAVEDSIVRNPLVLMKTRRDRAFAPLAGAATRVGGRPVDLLELRVVLDRITLAVDRENGRILQLRYTAKGGIPEKEGIMTISYSDFRSVDGLSYPFASESSFAGTKVAETHLLDVQLNRPLDGSLFRPPLVVAIPPTPTDTPAIPGSR